MVQQLTGIFALLLLLMRAEDADVPSEQLAEIALILLTTNRFNDDLGALCEPATQCFRIEAHRLVKAKEDLAARHTGAEPRSGVAKNEAAPARHILKCEALDIGSRGDTAEIVSERFARSAGNNQVGSR